MDPRRTLAASCIATLVIGASFTTATASPTRAQTRIPEGKFVELSKPTPKWYTVALHRKVVAAGKLGKSVPLPPHIKEKHSALLFTGIRPGSWMISPAWCTTNFVFGAAEGNIGTAIADEMPPPPGHGNSQSTGTGVYIGTAGHCTEVGDEVTIVAAPGVLMNIGTTVESVDEGVGDDFALIEVAPEWVDVVNPSMAIVAGPTGSKTPGVGDGILHVGHGLAIGTGGTPRPGVVGYVGQVEQPYAYGWDGAVTPGDSGSGSRSITGEAVGNVTHIYIEGTKYLPAVFFGTTIDRMLEIAGAPLATASLVPDPLP